MKEINRKQDSGIRFQSYIIAMDGSQGNLHFRRPELGSAFLCLIRLFGIWTFNAPLSQSGMYFLRISTIGSVVRKINAQRMILMKQVESNVVKTSTERMYVIYASVYHEKMKHDS